jgi:hypothetical protein
MCVCFIIDFILLNHKNKKKKQVYNLLLLISSF